MSESHFMSIFKDVTGLSFLKYLNHYRVERAQVMLTHSDDSMKNICQEVGFCDQSYFGAVFRKVVGLTPADYRRRFKHSGVPELPQVHQDSSLDHVSEKHIQAGNGQGIRQSEPLATGTIGPTLVANR